jgi:hypothetical protein
VKYAKVRGFLRNHEWAHTLTLEQACVVRFLLVTTGQFPPVDVLANPPKAIPTMRMVLDRKLQAASS